MSIPSSSTSSSEETNYYCHKCNQFITRLYEGTKCHFCRTQFIEEVDLNDTQAVQSLLSIDNSSRDESDSSLEYDDVFEDLSDTVEHDIHQRPRSTSMATFEIGLQRSPSEDSLMGFISSSLTSRRLTIPSATFSLLAEEFGFNPENIVINAGDVLSRIIAQIMGTGSEPMVPIDIERIPVATITQEQVSDGMVCTVCMEKFKIDEVVRQLVCDHFFHYECIKPWLSLHSSCPVCRQDLNDSESDSS
jgi:E3 ubiquitin-protein ligase RNF115/126